MSRNKYYAVEPSIHQRIVKNVGPEGFGRIATYLFNELEGTPSDITLSQEEVLCLGFLQDSVKSYLDKGRNQSETNRNNVNKRWDRVRASQNGSKDDCTILTKDGKRVKID